MWAAPFVDSPGVQDLVDLQLSRSRVSGLLHAEAWQTTAADDWVFPPGHRKTIGKPWENHRKMVISWDFMGFILRYWLIKNRQNGKNRPLNMVKFHSYVSWKWSKLSWNLPWKSSTNGMTNTSMGPTEYNSHPISQTFHVQYPWEYQTGTLW